ncbi:hypothetical protein BCV69DRAFT_284566 [Microstroma glucosiphilum]|uniref:Uncharacterized protein n=1 Tax=Pseudomicrostroma glucosiphilum TaxID=1684307 RepID=A0A316U0Y6_9BASI|nr:hypothetical protein BCV69DRAFT_284566 [Pseudomicrostroma glucosiphilum]PWN18957.1 hypothetical protein BCV69DRAFT_284566 [Pseudomicrostroma glucosiphilum]
MSASSQLQVASPIVRSPAPQPRNQQRKPSSSKVNSANTIPKAAASDAVAHSPRASPRNARPSLPKQKSASHQQQPQQPGAGEQKQQRGKTAEVKDSSSPQVKPSRPAVSGAAHISADTSVSVASPNKTAATRQPLPSSAKKTPNRTPSTSNSKAATPAPGDTGAPIPDPVLKTTGWAEMAEEEFGDPAVMSSFPLRPPPSDAQLAKKARQKAKQKEKQEARKLLKGETPSQPESHVTPAPVQQHAANIVPQAESTELGISEHKEAPAKSQPQPSSSVPQAVPLVPRPSNDGSSSARSDRSYDFHSIFQGGRGGFQSVPMRGMHSSLRGRGGSRFGSNSSWDGISQWREPKAPSMSPSPSQWGNGAAPPIMPRAQREAMERQARQQQQKALAPKTRAGSNSDASHSGHSTPATTVVSSPLLQSKRSLEIETQLHQSAAAESQDVSREAQDSSAVVDMARTGTGMTDERRAEASALVAEHGTADSESQPHRVVVKLPSPVVHRAKQQNDAEEQKGEDAGATAAKVAETQDDQDSDVITLPLPSGLPLGLAIDAEGQVWDLREGFANQVSHFSSPAVQQILRSSNASQAEPSAAPVTNDAQHSTSLQPVAADMPRSATHAPSHIPRSAARAAAFRPSGSISISASQYAQSQSPEQQHLHALFAAAPRHAPRGSIQDDVFSPSVMQYSMTTDGIPASATHHYTQSPTMAYFDGSLPVTMHGGAYGMAPPPGYYPGYATNPAMTMEQPGYSTPLSASSSQQAFPQHMLPQEQSFAQYDHQQQQQQHHQHQVQQHPYQPRHPSQASYMSPHQYHQQQQQ